MYNPMLRLRRFHQAFGVRLFYQQNVSEREATRLLRARLILEEAKEVIEALGYDVEISEPVPHGKNFPLSDLAKELADLKVVTYGTDEVFMIPAYEVFEEVMDSNMSKLGDDGQPTYRADGKVLKGPNYRPADIKKVLGL